MTVSLAVPPIASPVKDYLLQQDNLIAHAKRIHQQYYPELPWPLSEAILEQCDAFPDNK